MNAAQVLPDCTNIRRDYAEDLAHAIVEAIEIIGRPVSIFLDAAGALGCSWRGDVYNEESLDGMSLVGRYDEHAKACDIRDDILAMQREPIA